jgi:hypothetical protein
MERLCVYCDKHVFLIYLKKKSPIRGMGYEYFTDRQNHCLVSVRLTDASEWGARIFGVLIWTTAKNYRWRHPSHRQRPQVRRAENNDAVETAAGAPPIIAKPKRAWREVIAL